MKHLRSPWTPTPPKLAWALVIGALLVPTPSFAQAKEQAPPPKTDETTDWFAKGTAAHEAGRFAEAEELFLKVWAVRKAWDVAANLGLAEVNLGKHVAAAEHLSYALRGFPASEPAATKAVLERRLATARTEIGAIKLTVNVSGAEVKVGGETKGTSPLEGELFVAPGTAQVEVRKEGYETAKRTVSISKGGTETLSIEMVPANVPARSKTPAYVVGGLGVAGLIAGGALIGVALSQRSDLADKTIRDENGNPVCGRSPPDAHPDCPALRSQAMQIDALGNGGIVSMVIGGVLVGGAAAYYFWPVASPAPRAGTMKIFPVAGPGGGGMVWSGSF